MCFDSVCSVLFVVLSAILYPAFLNLWAIFSMWLLMYVSAVSYTHLDVYKRQELELE